MGSTGDDGLHFEEAGDTAAGDVLLLVHAFPFSSAMWRPQLTEPPQGWRVIAPDLRGYGGSPPIRDEQLTMDAAADDLARLLTRLGVKKAVVCGLSLGGYVTFGMLRRHPAQVRAVLLCDTRAAPDTPDAGRGRLEAAARIRTHGTNAFMESMLPKLLSPITRRRRPELVEEVASMMAAAPAESVAATLHGLALRPDSTPLLRSIVIPARIIVGEDDEITPPSEAQLMARGIPGARIETVSDAGHLPNLENPQVFNSLLGSFLAVLR
ncbi:alpha/beta fold hydrolase [soil metagenome]